MSSEKTYTNETEQKTSITTREKIELDVNDIAKAIQVLISDTNLQEMLTKLLKEAKINKERLNQDSLKNHTFCQLRDAFICHLKTEMHQISKNGNYNDSDKKIALSQILPDILFPFWHCRPPQKTEKSEKAKQHLHKEQQLFEEQQQLQTQSVFQEALNNLCVARSTKITTKPKIYFMYAKSIKQYQAREQWIPAFLQCLYVNLTTAGIEVVYSEKDNFSGNNFYKFMQQILDNQCYVIVFGTQSFRHKWFSNKTALQFEGKLLQLKWLTDLSDHQIDPNVTTTIIPFVLSGIRENAIPEDLLPAQNSTIDALYRQPYLKTLMSILSVAYGVDEPAIAKHFSALNAQIIHFVQYKMQSSTNQAIQLFLDNGKANTSHLEFNTWYHPEICHYLLQLVPNQAQWIRIIFHDTGDGKNTTSFKQQLKNLIALSNHLKKPALFIGKEPGAENHFIAGIINQGDLLFINPLGITDSQDCYPIFAELKQEGALNQIGFSSNALQRQEYEEKKLVSCGAIVLELAIHLLTTFTPGLFEDVEEQLTINELASPQSDLPYQAIDIVNLLSDTLKEIQQTSDLDSYQQCLCDIRLSHYHQLQNLPAEFARLNDTSVDDYLQKCKNESPAQVIFNALVFGHKTITTIHEMPEYKVLEDELHTECMGSSHSSTHSEEMVTQPKERLINKQYQATLFGHHTKQRSHKAISFSMTEKNNKSPHIGTESLLTKQTQPEQAIEEDFIEKKMNTSLDNRIPVIPNHDSRFAIGESDFLTFIKKKHRFIDKSLLIKAVIDDPSKVKLLIRPRRFGKTFNMSMLEAFFSKSLAQTQNTRLAFETLNIWKARDEKGEFSYQTYQGQYPVIFLTLKDVKEDNFEDSYGTMKYLISELYKGYEPILFNNIDGVLANDKNERLLYQKTIEQNAIKSVFKQSLKKLSEYLHRQYRHPAIILIDEYDTPIHASYTHHYYTEMTTFMRDFLGAALKDNKHVEQAILTGILRVAKESIFSGLNNLRIYSVLSNDYSPYFGFTAEEVKALLGQDMVSPDRLAEIETWYGGYHAGSTSLYNPWSMTNFIEDKQAAFKEYWINTSENSLVADLLKAGNPTIQSACKELLENRSVVVKIDEHLVFQDIQKEPNALWSFLLLSGYLTPYLDPQQPLEPNHYRLFIPSQEIYQFFQRLANQWFGENKLWKFNNPYKHYRSEQLQDTNRYKKSLFNANVKVKTLATDILVQLKQVDEEIFTQFIINLTAIDNALAQSSYRAIQFFLPDILAIKPTWKETLTISLNSMSKHLPSLNTLGWELIEKLHIRQDDQLVLVCLNNLETARGEKVIRLLLTKLETLNIGNDQLVSALLNKLDKEWSEKVIAVLLAKLETLKVNEEQLAPILFKKLETTSDENIIYC